MLLDARRREDARELLHVGGDDHGLDTVEGDAPALAESTFVCNSQKIAVGMF